MRKPMPPPLKSPIQVIKERVIEDHKKQFLDILQAGGTMTEAYAKLAITCDTMTKIRRNDKEFAKAVKEAQKANSEIREFERNHPQRESLELLEKNRITKERVLLELSRIALLDPLDYLNDDGTLKDIKDIPEDARRAIGGVEIQSGGTQGEILKKLKLIDKKGALDSLARHLGMFKDSIELNLEDNTITPDERMVLQEAAKLLLKGKTNLLSEGGTQ